MRGEQETNCLTRVKQNLDRNSVHYFCSDPQKIIRILKSARPNPAQSNFPDFLFENGFIEHFQITASRETRKGAEHRQRQAQFCKEAEQRFQRMGRELNDAPPANSLTREICEMEAPPYSYEMYEASFRKNWQHHINSLQKYTGCRDVGIFLVEYQGPLFKAMQCGRFTGFYHLHQDAPMLRYTAAYQDMLSYVIFTDGQNCEVIELEHIPVLLEQVPCDIQFEPGRWKEHHINLAIDMTIDGSEQEALT